VGTLGVQRLALGQGEGLAVEAHRLSRHAHQVHFHALQGRGIAGVVVEAFGVKVGVEFVVGAHQQVAVERRGHAGVVVVGRVQHRRVLNEIDADQQAAAGQRPSGHGPKGPGLVGVEVAERGAEIQADPLPGGRPAGGQAKGLHEVGHDGCDFQQGVVASQGRRFLLQVGP